MRHRCVEDRTKILEGLRKTASSDTLERAIALAINKKRLSSSKYHASGHSRVGASPLHQSLALKGREDDSASNVSLRERAVKPRSSKRVREPPGVRIGDLDSRVSNIAEGGINTVSSELVDFLSNADETSTGPEAQILTSRTDSYDCGSKFLENPLKRLVQIGKNLTACRFAVRQYPYRSKNRQVAHHLIAGRKSPVLRKRHWLPRQGLSAQTARRGVASLGGRYQARD